MNIWLVTVGEPLPLETNPRLLRTGLLAEQLSKEGHQVTWWSSSFNHSAKTQFCNEDAIFKLESGIRLVLLHGPRYRRNISVGRLLNHAVVARKFMARVKTETSPDIILCSFPTIELSLVASQFGKEKNIPVILDVRDLWPDIFLDAAPKWLRTTAAFVLKPYFNATKTAFKNSFGVLGTSPSYLNWGLNYANRCQAKQDRMIPIGFSARQYSSESIQEAAFKVSNFGISDSKVVAWFSGVFGTTYDIATIIETARLAQDLLPKLLFVLTGDGETRASFAERAKGLRNVLFTGWADGPLLHVLSKRADIGLAAYAAHAPQSLPNKIFEYSSAGLPIVSSLKGDAERLFSNRQCAISYEAGNAQSLLRAITPLVDSKVMRVQIGQNAKKLYESDFTIDKVNRNLIEYLQDVTGTFKSQPVSLQ